jgi:EmrB/QacA subfamily drug resistance transporter
VSFLGALDHTVVSTSLATIAGDLGALEQMSWVVVGYTLSSTVLLPVIGKLGDAVGPRLVFLTSLVAFLAASVLCGFAPSMGWLIVARVVQGATSAGLQLMSQTILAHVTSPRQRPRYMAIIGAAFPIAILIGPIVGGLITEYWGWSWVFWINVPIGVAALALAVAVVPHVEAAPRARFDIAGAVSFTLSLVALVLGVSWISDSASARAALIAFLVAALSFAVFLLVELKAAEPIVPLRMLRNRTIAAGLALSAIIGVGLFSVTAYLPTYFQMAYRTSITVSGLVPIATVFGMLVSNLVTGWLASRSGRYRVFAITGTSAAAIGLLTMAALPAGSPLWVPMVVMFLVGAGTGSFMSLIIAVVQSAAPRRELGTITASVNLVRQIGATVTTAVIGGVIATGVARLLPDRFDAASLTPQLVHSAPAGDQLAVAAIYTSVFVPIFIGLAVAYAVGVVAAILLPAGRLPEQQSAVLDAQPLPA